jgi:hypothetical protein
MKTTEARCPCGAVTIGLRGEPVTQFYCHCEDCRVVGGGAYIGLALFPPAAFGGTDEVVDW